MPEGKVSSRVLTIALYALICVTLVFMLIPILWMAVVSLESSEEVMLYPPVLPSQPHLENFATVMRDLPFVRFMFNSIIVTGANTIVGLLVASLSGYAFAKFRFRGRDFLFLLLLSVMMIPFEVTMVPLYQIMVSIGGANTYWAMILPTCTNVFAIFLMRQFIRYFISDDMINAARVEGCSEFQVFRKIILPLSRPGLATVGTLLVIWNWDLFTWPLLVADTTDMRVLTVGLVMYKAYTYGGWGYNYHLIMAATVITIIPSCIVFLLMNRYFIKPTAIAIRRY